MFKILILFLVIFYGIAYFTLIRKNPPEDSPQLKLRLGTTLFSHQTAATDSLTDNLYCYYPTAQATYPGKSGEYIIRRADNIKECNSWMGAAFLKENKETSERDKISLVRI